MKNSTLYKVTIKIKVHIKPLREIIYEKIGVFIKETNTNYIFDTFRVRKTNVAMIQEVIG